MYGPSRGGACNGRVVFRRKTIGVSRGGTFDAPFVLTILYVCFDCFLRNVDIVALTRGVASLTRGFSASGTNVTCLVSNVNLKQLVDVLFFNIVSSGFNHQTIVLVTMVVCLLFFFNVPTYPGLALTCNLTIYMNVTGSTLSANNCPTLVRYFPGTSNSTIVLIGTVISFKRVFCPVLIDCVLLGGV